MLIPAIIKGIFNLTVAKIKSIPFSRSLEMGYFYLEAANDVSVFVSPNDLPVSPSPLNPYLINNWQMQVVAKLCHVSWQRCMQIDPLFLQRLPKPQMRAMQGLPLKIISLPIIQVIAKQRMSDCSKMNANLMGAACV